MGISYETVDKAPSGLITREPPYRGWVSVVRRDAWRRWSLVTTGVGLLCLSPVVIGAWPAADPGVDPGRLRDEVAASAPRPYQGYIESTGHIDMPDLPQIGDVTKLLGGTIRIRAWYATPTAWRVAVLTPTGEQDTYRAGGATFIWDYERNLLTGISGELPIRLPWASDLTPPELARRLLSAAATDPVSHLPARRVAGMTAAGFRITPQDAASTIGRVDVWADPRTGLPVQIDVGARDEARAVFSTRFLDLRQQPPVREVITPRRPQGASVTTTDAPDVAAALNSIATFPLPAVLAGRTRAEPASPIAGVGTYGTGLSTFVAVPLPGRFGGRAIDAAERANAVPVQFDVGQGLELRTSILTTLVEWQGEWPSQQAFLLAGFVTPDLLRAAGAELLDAADLGRGLDRPPPGATDTGAAP